MIDLELVELRCRLRKIDHVRKRECVIVSTPAGDAEIFHDWASYNGMQEPFVEPLRAKLAFLSQSDRTYYLARELRGRREHGASAWGWPRAVHGPKGRLP